LDEHLEPGRMLATSVADAVIALGLLGRVTLSHLCVLATLDDKAAGALIEKLARAGITVVALPETNLFLQDRGARSPIRRGVAVSGAPRRRWGAGAPRHRQRPRLVLSVRRRRHARYRAVCRRSRASRRAGGADPCDLRRSPRDRGGRGGRSRLDQGVVV